MYYLGVDGGGSGCRAVLANAEGMILGRGAAGPANVFSDPEGALANVLAATRQATEGVCSTAEVVAVLGLAGVNAAGTGIALRLPFARTRVESDVFTALKGALRDAPGIVAAVGTGSVFVRQIASEITAVGGWGLTLGDEGSGAWLGRALCTRALRAVDGLAERTPLLAGLVTEMGGPAGVVRFAASARPADFAAFAQRIVASRDSAARAILAEATDLVAGAIAHLQPAGSALPVTFTGGLGPTYAKLLSPQWPKTDALGDGLEGALWLALQENSAPVRVAR